MELGAVGHGRTNVTVACNMILLIMFFNASKHTIHDRRNVLIPTWETIISLALFRYMDALNLR
jgi:hypothetical protein